MPLDWWQQGEMWAWADKEGLAATIWSQYHALGDEAQQGAIKSAMLAEVRHAKAEYMHQRFALAKILKAMNAASIPVICMRGKAVAEDLYTPSFLRGSTDIDLLYHEDDGPVLKQILTDSLGFSVSPKYPEMFLRDELPIDLHTEPLGITRILAWEHITPLRAPDFFEHSQQGEMAGEKALLVHPRVNLPYLCFHALKHSFERLIWLYDIALLANKVSEDDMWDEVLAGIQAYKLERPCYYVLAYVQAHLAAQVPDEILQTIQPKMGFFERRLFKRHMQHESIPFLAERLFSLMQPSLKHRLEFWRETIYPRYEVRKQIAGCGCVKCNFIRKRLKQVGSALWGLTKELFSIARA
ncbi:MAG: nucleotidyltransferase family protein [Mariprofundaceae bacterium]|nr:nucleotidyltransferase family protein [Mariprofundaceae bacterium]